MNSLNINFAFSALPLHSSLPMTPSSLGHTPSLPLQFDSLPLLYTLTALSPLANTVSFFLGLLFFSTMLMGWEYSLYALVPLPAPTAVTLS